MRVQSDMQKEVQRKMTFPELLEETGRSVSPEQLDAILSDTSTIVSAGAGSGKTTVLSLRFVRLVLDGKAHPDERDRGRIRRHGGHCHHRGYH